ncbi:Hypothetical protein SCF082_LOCUS11724 [Durusdinium trenchii]|uniref:PH domain-containing protein n=1 Tax=Durusdinium trenchii TaxID=1381693 RepID=A0ABP0JF73_9DINO
MIRTPGEASGCDAGGRTVSRTGGGAGGLFWDCAGGSGGLTINTDLEDEGPGTPATPSIDPEVLLQPSLSKGMPFHNGFLYKLGDGILNNTWNLRYFLLIGQTLQYYRSQHEARPRDAIHLSGVTVEWLKDQSRPFTFAVSKSGSRSYCLSGCSEQEASEWMERIQAASKLGSPPRVEIPTPSSARRCQILASELPLAVPAAQTWQEAKMKHCSQVLVQLLEHRGALRELRQGLRILEAPDSEELLRRTWKDLFFLLLLAMLGLGSLWAAWYVSAALLLAGAASLCFIARGVPVVAAAACVNVPVEEVKEALMEHWRFRDWQPDHLESLPLSLQPGRDEVLRLRCRTGIPGCHFSCELRRRWARSDGARLLLCVEESEGEITSFEGFAIQPLDDGCLVVWLCGLDLAPTPWTPRAVREALAVRRVSALAGLREWLRCRRNGPKTSVSRMEQKLAGGFGRSGAMLKDSLQLQVLPLLLRPFCRARKGGALEAPRDLDRAALSCDVLLELGRQALRGRGREVSVGSRPQGLLPQAGPDFVQRLSARWAYANVLALAGADARERLILVIAFMVAGLHLAAAGFPYLPWLEASGGTDRGRHSAVLPEDCVAHVDIQEGRRVGGVERPVRCAYEVQRASACGSFRVHGTDEVRTHFVLPSSFRFSDKGWTTVEFPATSSSVRFSMPELWVKHSSHRLGAGSTYEWHGPATFSDNLGNQCQLSFGHFEKGRGVPQEDIKGVLRDARGAEVGRIHGSWLGPLLCDGEVLWKGP